MTLSQPRDEAVPCPPLIQVPVASSRDKVTWRMAEGIWLSPFNVKGQESRKAVRQGTSNDWG